MLFSFHVITLEKRFVIGFSRPTTYLSFSVVTVHSIFCINCMICASSVELHFVMKHYCRDSAIQCGVNHA